jgi:carboxypeptidase A5
LFLLFGLTLHAVNSTPFIIEFSPLEASKLDDFTKFGELKQIDFLSHPSADLSFYGMVSETSKDEVIQAAEKAFGLNARDVTEEVQKKIEKQNEENDKTRSYLRLFRSANSPPLQYYATLDEIYTWMKNLAQRNPNNISLVEIGRSYENRPMYVLKINTGRNLPIVFVESTIHCREWLSPATTMYIIDKILNNYRSDVYSRFEFHFSLITNPDGYQYTHQNKNTIEGRFWRKNRRYFSSSCSGVDLNRNFDIYFGTVGISHDCRSATYCGPSAFSEPETRNLKTYVSQIARQVKLYLSIHTFGQMIIVPYTYTTNPPADNSNLRRIAQAAANSFYQVGRRIFYVGNTYELGLGVVSGSSVDWVKDKAGISTSFAFELQPRGVDAFNGGFNPSASAITPSGEETFAAFTTMLVSL